jgi:thymidylate synthase (FAD)
MPDTPPPRFRSDISVELVKANAQDSDVIWAARVSTAGEMSLEARDEDPERSAGLIRYLMRDRHGSPFEHTSMTFLVSAPIFVFREFMRHRVGWSYNEESGRYRQLQPVFYVPGPDRKLIQQGKAGQYHFVDGTEEQHKIAVEAIEESAAGPTPPTRRCWTPGSRARWRAACSRSGPSRRCTPAATRGR